MIQALKNDKTPKFEQKSEPVDIIVTRYETNITYDEKGREIKEMIPKKTNVTKLTQETSKLIKQDIAKEVISKVETLFNVK